MGLHSSFMVFEVVEQNTLWTLHPSFPFHHSPDMYPSLVKRQ